ncbi:MAG TPA: amino acid permease [Candidatus Angelobacter sp.]
MRLPHATAMVVGIIVGATVFIQSSEITHLVPTTRGVMLAWLLAGALTVCGVLVCAELSTIFPQTGGVYVFLKQIFSPAMGFLWGWAMFWSMHSGIIAAIAVVLARYVAYFLPLSNGEIRLLAMGSILLLSGINYLGIKLGGAVQLAVTAAKLAAVVLLVGLLFWFGGPRHRALPAEAAAPPASLATYGLAIAAGLFAFGGWHQVTYTAGETRDPERTIPRALLLGTLIVTICYMLLNAAYQYVLPLSEVAHSSHVAADASQRVLGTGAGGAIAALVVLSAFGSLNGVILAGPRVYYAMALDGLAFRWMGAVHPHRQTPHLALAAQAVWSCVLVATDSYRALYTRVVYSEWFFFALLAAGLFVLHRRREYKPVVLKRAYPFVPALFIVVSLAIVVNQCVANPGDSALGSALLLVGLPVYFVWSRRKPDAKSGAGLPTTQ